MSDGREQAIRCVRAMQGQDVETRAALWALALRYMRKSRDARAEGGAPASLPRGEMGSPCAGLE